MADRISLRPATLEDLPALNSLINKSIAHFCAGHYTKAQVDAVVVQATSGRYTDLIAKGTYFVLTANSTDAAVSSGTSTIIASGGYTPNRTVYSREPGTASTLAKDEPFNPLCDAAWVRGVYTSPSFAGRGLGRSVVKHCEASASRELGTAGMQMRFKLASTVNAVPFYLKCGYSMVGEEVVGVPHGELMRVVIMEKICIPDEESGSATKSQ